LTDRELVCLRVVLLPYVEHSLAGQFANKPTRGQTSRALVNSRTSQLANRVFKNHFIATLCLYIKLNLNHNSNAIEY